MNVLITGAFGYVGGRLAQHLATTGGFQLRLGSRRKVDAPRWCPEAEVARMDFDADDTMLAACSDVDAVVHLAGLNAQQCSADPVAALEVNGVGTARLVRAAITAGVRRFIHVSTAHVYGSPLEGVISEETCALGVHPYATSHRAGEDAVLHAADAARLEGIVIRLSNAFGPPVDERADCWMLLVNDLCRQVVLHRRAVLRSSGLQRRDFITLTESCRALAHLLRVSRPERGRAIFNLGGNWSPTVFDIATRIAECCERELGFRPQIERVTAAPGEASPPLDYRTDRLRSNGFIPAAAVDAEIAATLAFCAATAKNVEPSP